MGRVALADAVQVGGQNGIAGEPPHHAELGARADGDCGRSSDGRDRDRGDLPERFHPVTGAADPAVNGGSTSENARPSAPRPVTVTLTAATFAVVPPGVAVTHRQTSGLLMLLVTVEGTTEAVAAKMAFAEAGPGEPRLRLKALMCEPA